jgi:hypothetical protein
MATPAQRALAAGVASLTRWSREADPSAATRPAREGLRARFAREIDPDGTLPAPELALRVERAEQAHMRRMSLAAARARSARKQARS